MIIATDTLDRIFLKDEYKLRNIDASGILVFDLYDNGKLVSIKQVILKKQTLLSSKLMILWNWI